MAAEPCRVLVVDDNPDTASSFALLCQLDGHETECVTDGDRALEVARSFRPDIVVLDLVLHGSRVDGFQLARQMRTDATLSDVALVASTGLAGAADRGRAETVGFEYYFVKPADPDEVLQVIDQVLCRRRGRLAATR